MIATLQICIKWGLQHGTSVIPKGTSNEHVVGNLDVIDWELSSEDFEVSMLGLTCLQTAVIVSSVMLLTKHVCTANGSCTLFVELGCHLHRACVTCIDGHMCKDEHCVTSRHIQRHITSCCSVTSNSSQQL